MRICWMNFQRGNEKHFVRTSTCLLLRSRARSMPSSAFELTQPQAELCIMRSARVPIRETEASSDAATQEPGCESGNAVVVSRNFIQLTWMDVAGCCNRTAGYQWLVCRQAHHRVIQIITVTWSRFHFTNCAIVA